MSIYKHKESGHIYKLIGEAVPAGSARKQGKVPIAVYYSMETGQLYYRMGEREFHKAFEKVEG